MTKFGRYAVLASVLMASGVSPGCAQQRVAPGGHQQDMAVFLGGTSGLLALADPAASAQYRATGRGGFNLDYSATDPALFGGALRSIAKNFHGTGPGMAELGLFHAGFFNREWKNRVLVAGLAPRVAMVNMPLTKPPAPQALTEEDLNRFKAMVDEGRAAHVMVLAPVVSPNGSGGAGPAGDARTLAVAHPWSDAWWNNAKAAALYGGGIALDNPPAAYLHGLPDNVQMKAYQVFSHDQLAWAAQNNLAAYVIISPFFDSGTFLHDAQLQYQNIAAEGALPTSWVIENYNLCGPPHPQACRPTDAAFGAPVGAETEANSVASIALWFARNAQVRPYHGSYAGVTAAE